MEAPSGAAPLTQICVRLERSACTAALGTERILPVNGRFLMGRVLGQRKYTLSALRAVSDLSKMQRPLAPLNKAGFSQEEQSQALYGIAGVIAWGQLEGVLGSWLH
jgi:hypothetical protein